MIHDSDIHSYRNPGAAPWLLKGESTTPLPHTHVLDDVPEGKAAITVLQVGEVALAARVTALEAVRIQAGMIVMWSGSVATIPQGWGLCDGTRGTPDLRDKFVVGARQDDTVAKTNVTGSLTQTGGAASHAHTGTTDSASDQLTSASQVAAGADYGNVIEGHQHTFTTDSASGLPPYYALAFVMKLA